MLSISKLIRVTSCSIVLFGSLSAAAQATERIMTLVLRGKADFPI